MISKSMKMLPVYRDEHNNGFIMVKTIEYIEVRKTDDTKYYLFGHSSQAVGSFALTEPAAADAILTIIQDILQTAEGKWLSVNNTLLVNLNHVCVINTITDESNRLTDISLLMSNGDNVAITKALPSISNNEQDINQYLFSIMDKMTMNPSMTRTDAKKTKAQPYEPTCPIHMQDCILDPAYIHFHHPDWYKELYGNIPPNKVHSCHNYNLKHKTCSDYNDEDK